MKIVFLVITAFFALQGVAGVNTKESSKYLIATILMAMLTLVAYRIG